MEKADLHTDETCGQVRDDCQGLHRESVELAMPPEFFRGHSHFLKVNAWLIW